MKINKMNAVCLLLFFASSVFNMANAQHQKFKQVQRFELNMPKSDTAWSEPQVFILAEHNGKRTQQVSVQCKYVKHKGTTSYFEVRTTNLGPSTFSTDVGLETAKEQFYEGAMGHINVLGKGWWSANELRFTSGFKGKKMSGVERAVKSGPIHIGFVDVYFGN